MRAVTLSFETLTSSIARSSSRTGSSAPRSAKAVSSNSGSFSPTSFSFPISLLASSGFVSVTLISSFGDATFMPDRPTSCDCSLCPSDFAAATRALSKLDFVSVSALTVSSGETVSLVLAALLTF